MFPIAPDKWHRLTEKLLMGQNHGIQNLVKHWGSSSTVCIFGVQGASTYALTSSEESSRMRCGFVVSGEVKEGKKAVIRGCILDCIRKLDFRLTNVPQHPGRAHTAAGVVQECRAGLRQCKHSSTSRCNQWSHLTLLARWYCCAAASLRRQTKVSKVRPSKPSPNRRSGRLQAVVVCEVLSGSLMGISNREYNGLWTVRNSCLQNQAS